MAFIDVCTLKALPIELLEIFASVNITKVDDQAYTTYKLQLTYAPTNNSARET